MKRTQGKMVTAALAGLIGLSFTLAPQAAFADWEKNVDKRVERMTEHLTLTPDQVTQVRAILEAEKEAIKQKRAESEQKIVAILTPEQQEKHNKMLEKMKEKKDEKREDAGN